MSETMRVFKNNRGNGRNFTIIGIRTEDILWKDFGRLGNPSKNVPAGGYATFCIKFDSPNAGITVAETLEEAYDVHTGIVKPDDGSKPYKTMKLACRFDKFPPTIILHSNADVILTHSVQRDPGKEYVDNAVIEEFNKNVASLQHMTIDHIDLEVNVSKDGKPYITSMDFYQALDPDGNPLMDEENSSAVRKGDLEELIESPFPEDE